MEANKMKVIIVSLVTIIIVVASLGFYFLNDEASGFTAKKGYYIAADEARQLSDEYILYEVHGVVSVINGSSEIWTYDFIFPSTVYLDHLGREKCKYMSVWVYDNGTAWNLTSDSYYNTSHHPIRIADWKIDSERALNIINREYKMSEYIQNRSNENGIKQYGYSLWMHNDSNQTIINIQLIISYGNYSLENIQWEINAFSGEIIFYKYYYIPPR